MEPRERATNPGIEMAVGAALSAAAIIVGSRLMESVDFTTPLLIMAAGLMVSTIVYWSWFRPLEIGGATDRASPAAATRDAPDMEQNRRRII